MQYNKIKYEYNWESKMKRFNFLSRIDNVNVLIYKIYKHLFIFIHIHCTCNIYAQIHTCIYSVHNFLSLDDSII